MNNISNIVFNKLENKKDREHLILVGSNDFKMYISWSYLVV